MQARHILVTLFVAVVSLSAYAFDRNFPPIAKRGEMRPADHPAIIINGKTRLLSAGARIWNDENLIEMPSSLRNGKYIVNYTENDAGEIDRLWILTRDEAAQQAPDKAAKAAERRNVAPVFTAPVGPQDRTEQ